MSISSERKGGEEVAPLLFQKKKVKGEQGGREKTGAGFCFCFPPLLFRNGSPAERKGEEEKVDLSTTYRLTQKTH